MLFILCFLTHPNTTNSINDWPCSGRPRVTTPCQDMYILWQHMINQFTRASKHHDNLQPQEANLICMFNISFGFTNKFVFPAHHTQFFFQHNRGKWSSNVMTTIQTMMTYHQIHCQYFSVILPLFFPFLVFRLCA
jgi:hypothetical protein